MLTPFLFAQKKQQLEDKRRQLKEAIRKTSILLEKTKQSKRATFERFLALKQQIESRKLLIETLQEEIGITNQSIQRSYGVVELLEEDIKRLKEEYSDMVRLAYRQKLTKSTALFIFSARNFNDAFRRWQYLKQYDAYRQKQAKLIVETQNTLNEKVANLESRRQEKQKLLDSEERQTAILRGEMTAKNQLLKKLKSDESRLSDDLQAKEKAHSKLNDAIERIIREEMEQRRREEAALAAGSATESDRKSSENRKAIAGVVTRGFLQNKGRLPWPVKNGIISRRFGRQPHPTIPTIEINNNGIDIQAAANAEVKAVHDGKVLSSQSIPGNNLMIIIQHGNFYTVYSDLEEVYVQKGEKVAARQRIGKAGVDPKSNLSEVHFEVWKEKQLQNPVKWLKR